MKQDLFFKEAYLQTFKSSYKKPMGCIIVNRNRIVGRGCNFVLGKGLPKHDSIHAEIHALNKTKARYRKSSIAYVCRRYSDGTLAMAKPCTACETVLRKLGVKKVWYSINNGWDSKHFSDGDST